MVAWCARWWKLRPREVYGHTGIKSSQTATMAWVFVSVVAGGPRVAAAEVVGVVQDVLLGWRHVFLEAPHL
jgi:hypothetical protein